MAQIFRLFLYNLHLHDCFLIYLMINYPVNGIFHAPSEYNRKKTRR